MSKINWAIICDYAFVDPNDKLYIIGTFTNIWAKGFPTTHPSFYILTNWSGSLGERVSAKIRILDPSDNLIIETQDLPVEFKSENHVILSNFALVNFPKAGDYRVQVISNGKEVHTLKIKVAAKE